MKENGIFVGVLYTKVRFILISKLKSSHTTYVSIDGS